MRDRNGFLLRLFKLLLTVIGAMMSNGLLLKLEAVLNYLRVGRWMSGHGYRIPFRVRDREDVWEALLRDVQDKEILYLEFGVAWGGSISYWSQRLKHSGSILHGFDSFEGLPEETGPWKKGQFNANGNFPSLSDSRVRFFKGWFDQVLPTYQIPPHSLLVVNMDADLYSSTIYVLRHLRPYFKVGSLIYFDEFNHVDHEPRAFDDFQIESGLRFRVVAADKTLAFVAFECVG